MSNFKVVKVDLDLKYLKVHVHMHTHSHVHGAHGAFSGLGGRETKTVRAMVLESESMSDTMLAAKEKLKSW